ncbi:MAG: hypothetical protein QM688_05100 [Sphingomonas bacterium]
MAVKSTRAAGVRRTMTTALALAAATSPLPAGIAQAADGGEDKAQDPHFVPMQEISVPIVDSDRINGVLRFKLVLAARDGTTLGALRSRMPELRAAGIAAGLEFARLEVSGLRPVDAVKFSRELQAALSGVEPMLARVLIVELAAEPA